MVEGQNFAIRFPSRKSGLRSLFEKGKVAEKVGFFATRLTVADTESDAGRFVVEAIKHELASQWKIENVDSDPPILLVSEIRHADLTDPSVAAKGFTFYAHDERH